MFEGTPGIKVSVESLTIFVYIIIIIWQREDSLSDIRVLHWKLCPSESVGCRVFPLISKLSFRFFSSFSVGQCVWELQNYDARIFHPFSCSYTPVHKTERHMEGETANIWERCSTSEKEEHRHSTVAGECGGISHHDHSTPCGMEWGGAHGLLFRRLGAVWRRWWSQRRKHPPPKVNKARYSRSKMRESHCESVAHDATQKRTEILGHCARISGLRSGSAGNNPLSKRSTWILP